MNEDAIIIDIINSVNITVLFISTAYIDMKWLVESKEK